MTRIAHDHVQSSNRGRVSIDRDPVASILAMYQSDATSRPVALAAKCCQCRGNAVLIRACDDRSCALWLIRPFQRDVAAKSAPHVVARTSDLEEPTGLLLDESADDVLE